jgi:hypothetical protein
MEKNKFLFVGEKRSQLSLKMNVTWKDGRLAAKQLFDCLIMIGVDPKIQEFENWFDGDKDKIRKYKGIIVAMGGKVQLALSRENIKFIPIYHPATRGIVRKKENYAQHLKNRMKDVII